MQARSENSSFLTQLSRRFSLQGFIFAIVLTFFLTSILFPFYWMVSSSFKTRAEIGGREPIYVPGELRLEAYDELFNPDNPSYQQFATNIRNTVFVAVPTAVIAVILAVLCHCPVALSRQKFDGQCHFGGLSLPWNPAHHSLVCHAGPHWRHHWF